MRTATARSAQDIWASGSLTTRGFSLVEVLVALVVVSVGLLGLAKMEAVGLSSTSVAGVRSLVASQTANMAAMMHANQDYWQTSLVMATPTIKITSASNPYSAAQTCNASGTNACLPQSMANNDLNIWATSLKQILPVYAATITCAQNPAGNPLAPYTCSIQVNWPENAVAVNNSSVVADQQSTALITAQSPAYTLYVQP